MNIIFPFIKRYKWPAIIAFSFMLLELFADLMQPLLMAKLINDGLLKENLHNVAFWGGCLFILALFSFLSGVLNSIFSAHVAHSYAYDIRRALYSKIQSLTMATYMTFQTSGLITRLTSDITQTMNIVFMMLRIAMKAPLMTVGSLLMVFLINVKLAIILCIAFPFLLVFLIWMMSIGIKLFAQVQNRLDNVNKQLQESLQAVRLIKAYMRGQYEESRFFTVAENLKLDTMKATRVMEIALPVLQFFMNVSLLVVIWVGADYIRANELLVGDLAAIVNYAFRMTASFSIFSFIIIAYARAKASANRIGEVLTLTEQNVEEVNTAEHARLEAFAIDFQNVSFHYPQTEEMVLQNMSFSIQNGEKIALMGATGSGKSTIIQLIENFYSPTAGNILINGKNIAEIPLQQLRISIAYVPQQSLLFSGSIFDNLRWGRTEATIEEMHIATKKAQIYDSIIRFEKGFDTMIGQKGVNLSGGQKQRLAIARALLKPASLLILDDSTSALDVDTEKQLWEALDQEHVTTLVITQKIQTAKSANRILLIEDGQISGFASHDELMQSNALYRKIAASQQEESKHEII